MRSSSRNVLLSVVDALASGTPVVTSWHRGIQRLLQSAAPIVSTSRPPLPLFPRLWVRAKLCKAMGELLRDEPSRTSLVARSIAFARARLDIYAVLERMLAEQLL